MKRLFVVLMAIGFPLVMMAQNAGELTVSVGTQDLLVKSNKAIKQVTITSITTGNGYSVMDGTVVVKSNSERVVIIPLAMDDIPILKNKAMDDIPILKNKAMDDIPILKNQVMDDIPILKNKAMDDIPILKTSYVVEVITESGEVFVKVVE